MLIPNHPADERLSALASHDVDAVDDAGLTAHVAACPRCTATVDELSSLRLALSELSDLAPDRPLRLLPPADAAPDAADRLSGWVRRFFTPVLASGAAVALVGLIGTTGLVPGAQQAAVPEAEGAAELEAMESTDALFDNGGGDTAAAAPSAGMAGDSGAQVSRVAEDDDGRTGLSPLASQRSPWPMVLFAGVAIMVGALLLRWILVPRAG